MEQLKTIIARILDPAGKTVGTGFLVTEDGVLTTCAHVVQYAKAGPGGRVRLRLVADGQEHGARVLEQGWHPPEAGDLAFLKLEGDLPPGLRPLSLGSSKGVFGHRIRSFGFPEHPASIDGLWGVGTAYGSTAEGEAPLLQLNSNDITTGFSGAPVWDEEARCIIGQVVSITRPDAYGRQREIAFITPAEKLKDAYGALTLRDLCPYRGLQFFTQEDARFFFGREQAVGQLVHALKHRELRFLAVLGPSGSGKSSLLQAGLIPELRRGAGLGSARWAVRVGRPGNQPFHALAALGLEGAVEDLPHAARGWLDAHPEHPRLVLVLDQFEEFLTNCEPAMGKRFVAQLRELLDSIEKLTLILVFRDDFYSRFVEQAAALVPWLERNLQNVPAELDQRELRAIIEEPARAVGLELGEGLVDTLLEDVLKAHPGSAPGEQKARSTILPLLEFALTEIWEQRQEGKLLREAYVSMGGITGGLTQWADQALRQLGEEQGPLARRVLLDLVHLGDESQGLPDSRRRSTLGALLRSEEERERVHGVVRHLADARLLVTGSDPRSGEETVELIHDALIREWGQLRRWLQEDRLFLMWRQELERQLQKWKRTGPEAAAQRDETQLLQGRDLTEAEGWLTARGADLSEEERQFIQLSQERRRKEEQRWKALYEEAERQREEAERQRVMAVALQLAAQSEALRGPTGESLRRSALLAVESLKRRPTVEGDQALRHGLALLPRPLRHEHFEGWIWALEYSPNGRYLASGLKGSARVWEVSTGKQLVRIDTPRLMTGIAFSPDGRLLATVSEEGIVRLGEATRDRELWRKEHERAGLIAFSPSGKYLATAGWDGTARMWEAATGQELLGIRHEGDAPRIVHVAFTPDERHLLTVSWNERAALWDVRTGDRSMELQVDKGIWAAASSGRLLAAADPHGAVTLWELPEGREVARLEHTGELKVVAFSPDGQFLATGGTNDTATLWSASSGQKLGQWSHQGTVNQLAFSPDGHLLATGSNDKTARIWRIETGQEIARMVHDASLSSLAFSPNSRHLSTGSEDGHLWSWEVPSGKQIGELTHVIHENDVSCLAFSRDGNYLATGGYDATARVWDLQRREQVACLPHQDIVRDVIFSPDGKRLATRSWEKIARIWDVAARQERVMLEDDAPIASLAISHDWRFVATASHRCVLWDAATGRKLWEIPTQHSAVDATISPDGKYLATCEQDSVRVWEVEGKREIACLRHSGELKILTFSPDGRFLGTCSEDNTILVWEWASSREAVRLGRHVTDGVIFSADSRYVSLRGCTDKTLPIWDTSTGAEVTLLLHEDRIRDVAFSPDGRHVASGGDDDMVRIWEVATGREIARMAHPSRVNVVAFSPKGEYLATADYSHHAWVWRWRTEDLLAEACARLTRNLTPEEWRQHLGTAPYRPTYPDKEPKG